MAKPSQLTAAREHLSRAESDFRSEDGLSRLREGLALLEEVALDGEPKDRKLAANLLATYSSRICASVRELVEARPGLPEPELEHLFRVLLAFDLQDLELPEYVRPLKVVVARRLVDRYYEGYPEGEKRKVLEQLAGIADDK